jgi:NitT/TauT family transport system substrate-binding protein
MSIERRLTRRRLLGAAAAALSGITCPRLVFAQTKRPVHFTLPWVAEGSNLFTFVAKGMGFWEKHGLDVDIARGSGSVAAAQAIGEGRFDFGMASPSAAILQAVKGLPMMALAACAYDATMGIGVMNDGPIKTPKDLEGRQMASTAKRLSEDEAISLMSVAVDFGVSQVVDANWGIHAVLKKAIFHR